MRLLLAVVGWVGLASVGLSAATYHTSIAGSDANPGTAASPFRTLLRGVSSLGPGDVLLVGPGTYRENLNMRIPSGASWASPVTVRAANPSDRPVLQAPPGTSHGLLFQGQQFIVIDGFVVDGVNTQHDSVKITQPTTRNIRVQNSEIKNAPRQGVLTTDGAQGVELLNLDIHDNGRSDFDHGIYLSTGQAVISGCRVYLNSGWGIHLYKENSTSGVDDNVVRENFVFDNARVGARGDGILVSSGARNQVYNNVVHGNRTGIVVDYGASESRVHHNTVAANVGEAVYVGSESSGAVVQNNLIYGNAWDVLVNRGTRTLASHNVMVNPSFVDFSGRDFRLAPGSVAVDAGVRTTVLRDIRGVSRDASPDVGAYEFDRQSVPPTAPSRVRVFSH